MSPSGSCVVDEGDGVAGKRQLCLATEPQVTTLWHGAGAMLGEQDGLPRHGVGSMCHWEQREHLLSSSQPSPFSLFPGGSAGPGRYQCLSCQLSCSSEHLSTAGLLQLCFSDFFTFSHRS